MKQIVFMTGFILFGALFCRPVRADDDAAAATQAAHDIDAISGNLSATMQAASGIDAINDNLSVAMQAASGIDAIDDKLSDAMLAVRDIYEAADKGNAANAVIGKKTALEMQTVLGQTGDPVYADGFHLNMANYEVMEQFLTELSSGNDASCRLYEILGSGGIGLREFHFSEGILSVNYQRGAWRAAAPASARRPQTGDTAAAAPSSAREPKATADAAAAPASAREPKAADAAATREPQSPFTVSSWTRRVSSWNYTENGWLFLDYDVPSAPQLSEVVYSTTAIRVTPRPESFHAFEEQYLDKIGFQSSNLLLVNWREGEMENVDFNALFDALYWIEYGERAPSGAYAGGIPENEFEALLTACLPVSAAELRELADYDAGREIYARHPLTQAAGPAGILIADIIAIEEHDDGTYSAHVNVVNEPGMTDCRFSFTLEYTYAENGRIRFLSNQIQ